MMAYPVAPSSSRDPSVNMVSPGRPDRLASVEGNRWNVWVILLAQVFFRVFGPDLGFLFRCWILSNSVSYLGFY